MTDLRCKAVRVMPHEYLAQRSLLHRDECVTFKVLNTRLMVDVLAFGTQHQQSHVRCGIRTLSERIHQVEHGWEGWKTGRVVFQVARTGRRRETRATCDASRGQPRDAVDAQETRT